MRITDQLVDQTFTDLKAKCGGIRNDYFALLYLQHDHDAPREEAIEQVALVGTTTESTASTSTRLSGISTSFNSSTPNRTSNSRTRSKGIIDAGMQYVFSADKQDKRQNQLIQQSKYPPAPGVYLKEIMPPQYQATCPTEAGCFPRLDTNPMSPNPVSSSDQAAGNGTGEAITCN